MSEKFVRIPQILATGADVAVNTETTVTIGAVGDKNVYRITSIYIPLVTDANVANRHPAVTFTFSGSIFKKYAVATVIPASITGAVVLEAGAVEKTDGLGAEYIRLPDGGIDVRGGTVIDTATLLLQATDNYGIPVVYGTIHKEDN